MSVLLTIDQGNTMSKACVFDNGAVADSRSFSELDIESLAPVLEQFGVTDAIYCSVARLDIRLIETLRCCLPGEVLTMTHATPLPIAIDYATPRTLGMDRIAAAVGAARLFPAEGSLVVDAGSAITLDVVDATGTFRGGNISAGVDMRLRALHEYTSRLPRVEHDGPLPLFGHDTETALRVGALRGAIYEIEGAMRQARDRFGCSHLVITGGNARLLAPLLEEAGCSLTVAPTLVADGLYAIFKHNEGDERE